MAGAFGLLFRSFRPRLLPLLPLLLFPSCALFQAREKTAPEPSFLSEFTPGPFPHNTVFVPAALPEPRLAPGVGIITRDERDLAASLDLVDRNHLSDSFKSAYLEGVLRGVRLTGVLGGDFVHGWPPRSPAAWVQNWQSSSGNFNSWGEPVLVLALRGLGETRVFTVQGDILDAYGVSGGLNGANGAAGYGAPCGEEFLLEGRRAQWFEHGLITFGRDGKAVFLPGGIPSAAAPVPESAGILHGEDSSPLIQQAFQSAWQAAVNSGLSPLEADAPVISLEFDSPWLLDVDTETDEAEEEIRMLVNKIHYQSFGNGKALFVMAEASLEFAGQSAALPLFPKIVVSPFLEVLLNAKQHKASGAEHLEPDHFPPGFAKRTGLSQMLLDGIALYGLPLSGGLPRNEGAAVKKAQRFSRGWLLAEPE
jgi:hypothetical protein